ncbi:GNAT family N-acetyltransferase [Bittarella massiliensis]|nr:GNAT family N-acetyltransferase [Bittarella massiliensis (ex Durand et al. 2017)]
MVLETERLTLREMEQGDFAGLSQMPWDPQVMRAYEHDFTPQEVQDRLDRQRERYARYGFGLWAACRKANGETVGQAGLTWQPCEGAEVLEVGYLLKRRFWHQGYARETAAACRDCAFTALGAEKVHAVIKSDNLPSIRVARALGMERERAFLTRYYSGERLHFLCALRRRGRAPKKRGGTGCPPSLFSLHQRTVRRASMNRSVSAGSNWVPRQRTSSTIPSSKVRPFL